MTEDADQTGRGEPGRITNAQVVVTPDGEVTSRYDKVRRVPFGEYVPMRGLLEALGAPVDQVRTNAVPGTTPAVIELPDGTKLGVVISWEVFFGGRAREGVKHGGVGHHQPDQRRQLHGHRASRPSRSRRAGCAPSRPGAGSCRPRRQASPRSCRRRGVVHQRTGVSERAVITREIDLRSGRTWYMTIGDGPWIVVVLVFLVAVWFAAGAALDRRRAARPGAQPAD